MAQPSARPDKKAPWRPSGRKALILTATALGVGLFVGGYWIRAAIEYETEGVARADYVSPEVDEAGRIAGVVIEVEWFVTQSKTSSQVCELIFLDDAGGQLSVAGASTRVPPGGEDAGKVRYTETVSVGAIPATVDLECR